MHHPYRSNFCGYLLSAILFLILGASESAAHVCTAAASATSLDMGSNSVGAINGGMVAVVTGPAGLSCTGGLLTLGATNSVTATVTSANNFQMKLTGQTGGVTYTLAAGSGGNTPIVQGATIQYYNTALLTLLGLSTSGPLTLPIYAQATSSTALPAGTYSDTLSIVWHWNICTVGVGGACVTRDTDPTTPSTTSTVNLQIEVAPKPMTLTVSRLLQSDPINSASSPKSIPGAITKYTMTIKNNDVVAANAGTIAVNAPVPTNTSFVVTTPLQTIATSITLVDGSPASGLTLVYSGAASTTDDVDFSTDGGTTWTYSPTANASGVDPLVTNVRLRPEGAMAAGGAASINIFCMVK